MPHIVNEDTIDELRQDVKDIKRVVCGTIEKPESGYGYRLKKLEDDAKSRQKWAWLLIVAFVGLAAKNAWSFVFGK